MATMKHRYIAIKIISKELNGVPFALKDIISKSIKEMFGEIVLSKINTLEVLEFYEKLNIAIVKCNIGIHKYVCYSLATLGTAQGKNTYLKILTISGILKKAKLQLIKILKNDNIQRLIEKNPNIQSSSG